MNLRAVLFLSSLASASLLLTSCGGGNGSGPTPPVQADVYIAGVDNGQAVYWKNGIETVLPGQGGIAYAIALSGTDVYVGGSVPGSKGPMATIWVNGQATTLTSDLSQVNAIAVANGNVYAAGGDQSAGLATLWVNGKPTQLTDGMGIDPSIPNFTDANSIFVDGSDVYVAGLAGKSFEISPDNYWTANVAVYWKNGVATDLSTVSNQSPNIQAVGIAVSGSDIYVGGNIGTINQSPPLAVYWKNGVQTQLSPAASYASSLTLSGSNVYVAGAISTSTLGYWMNGTATSIGSSSGVSEANQIAVNGADVYIAGTAPVSTSHFSAAAYWKNGTVTVLTPSATMPTAAYGIALVTQQQ